MDIKAIETRYKGYRFRSRLEARWAVTFDTAGLKWEYEPEGYKFGGVKYLPDFYISSEHFDGFVEIKPDMKTLPKVYMAGRMGVVDWRDWRPGCIPNRYVLEEPHLYAVHALSDDFAFIYTGPYGDGMDNHSFLHGADGAKYSHENEIINRSYIGIRAADFVVAVIKDKECYGTLTEIGYAKALNKKIYIAVIIKHGHETYDIEPFDDLWFAIKSCDEYKTFGDVYEARKWLLKKSGAVYSPERRKINELSNGLNKDGCIAYGVPGEHTWVGKRVPHIGDHAFSVGKQAQFEHGQRGT